MLVIFNNDVNSATKKMNFSTYVISLKDELKRRQNIKTQLDTLGIEFEFFDAIDLRNSNDNAYYNNHEGSYNLQRKLTSGEVGCALSHINIYNQILSNKYDWSWIIEDDALLNYIINKKIEHLISLASEHGADVVILGYSKLSYSDSKKFYIKEPIKIIGASENGYTLGIPWKNWTCGTVSYLISKNGARKIINNHIASKEKIVTVADDWLFFEKKCGLKILHCRPLMVYEDYENHISSIEKERSIISKKNMSILEPIRITRGLLRKLIMTINKKCKI